jgi:hypothetical protein
VYGIHVQHVSNFSIEGNGFYDSIGTLVADIWMDTDAQNSRIVCGLGDFSSTTSYLLDQGASNSYQCSQVGQINKSPTPITVGDTITDSNNLYVQTTNSAYDADMTFKNVAGTKQWGLYWNHSAGSLCFEDWVNSRTPLCANPDGTLYVSSTAPPTNLNARPVTYNAAGTQQTNTHVVVDTCTLGTNCAVTFSGSAAFSSGTTYRCTANDATAANAVKVQNISNAAVTFTGTGTDVVAFICIGN